MALVGTEVGAGVEVGAIRGLPVRVMVHQGAPKSVHPFGLITCIDADSFWIQVVVEKLTKNVTEAHLHEIFGRFGDIQNLDLPMNKSCKSTSTYLLTLYIARQIINFTQS